MGEDPSFFASVSIAIFREFKGSRRFDAEARVKKSSRLEQLMGGVSFLGWVFPTDLIKRF